MTHPKTEADLEREVGALADLARPALVAHWRTLYRCDPPKGLSRRLLVLAIAYRMQVKRYGGLRPGAQRRLLGNGCGAATTERSNARTSARLATGTRLIREWNGVTHVVDVAEGHFVWNGARYGSLSAVARAITGARWSGPRFFGVRRAVTRKRRT